MPLGSEEQLLRAFAAFDGIARDSAAQDFFKSEEGKAYRVPLVQFVASALQVRYGEGAQALAEELVDSLQTFQDIAALIRSPVKLAEQIRCASSTSGEYYSLEDDEQFAAGGQGQVAEAPGAITEGLRDKWSQGKKAVSGFLSVKSDFERKQELACAVDAFMAEIKAPRAELAKSGNVSERMSVYLKDVDTLLEILFSQCASKPGVSTYLFNKADSQQDMRLYVDGRKDIIIPAVRELLSIHGLDRVYDQKMAGLLENVSSKAYLRSYLRSAVTVRGFQGCSQSAGIYDPDIGRQPEQQSAKDLPTAAHSHPQQPYVQAICAVPQYTITRSKAFNALCALLFISLFALLLLIPLLHEHIPMGTVRDVIAVLAEVLIAVSIMALGCWLIFSGNCHKVHLPAMAEIASEAMCGSGQWYDAQDTTTAAEAKHTEPPTSTQGPMELKSMATATPSLP
ncbi:hypothetical protein ACIS_00633 [Anaplasma centrale str. Israel]|uniref:Uncharacterized protein n=1 Tax=Anaplasma centrale (strain Israel) TaxID=574556 RepID=D1AUI8_ANACI|nr:hypothetical protein [Anaplasma centrale]ACZ49216.1 hypothetical protein ACIS_00633 [Anaplasma centrale str. Israel]